MTGLKKLIFFTIALLLCTDAGCASKQRYSGSRIFWDSRSPVTVFPSGGYARVTQLADGRLMACCESGGIKVAFSSNMGATWTTPRLIAANSNNTPNCVPDLIQLKDGTIIVAYNPRPSAPYTEDRRFGIRLRRSTDNGSTWSEEIFVFDADCVFENGCWEPSLLELPTGELQLYFADESPYTSNGDQQISVCRSWDGGLTWTAPGKVSYRQGFRDGMPVPVLLSDGKTIVVAIEDNGYGFGDFIPATVRTPLTVNWRSFVSGQSTYRRRAVSYTYCPVAKGGAPYLRVLPDGQTVLSHQSCYNHGSKHNMYVYVGTDKATDFKAMSTPFYLPETKEALWNSLAVVDTGVVMAVAGYDGGIHVVKGYPKNRFEVPFASPVVDGKLAKGEGYHTDSGRQVMLGSGTGTYSYFDFAFDADSLYVYCLVYDSKKVTEGENADCVSLSFDTGGGCYDAPQGTSFRYDVSPAASVQPYVGDGEKWVVRESCGARAVVRKTTLTYTMEVAVPWNDMGRTAPVTGTEMSVNVEVTNGDGTQTSVEKMADAKPLEPWTWMPMHLPEDSLVTSVGRVDAGCEAAPHGTYDLSGRAVANGARGILIVNGKKTAY